MSTVTRTASHPQTSRQRRPHVEGYQRPWRVEGGNYATEEAARCRAQQLADEHGRPIEIVNLETRRRWLTVRPVRYLCPHSACRAEVDPAEFRLAWRLWRCRSCAADFPDTSLDAETWSACPWPEWVPAGIRAEISGRWWRFGPTEWLKQTWSDSVPTVGAVVTAWVYAGTDADRAWSEYLPARRQVTGRLVYGWRHVGWVIPAEGEAECVCVPASPRECPRLEYPEWLAEGERRFGPDRLDWRFQCPVCSGEQSARSVSAATDADPTAVARWVKHQCSQPQCGRSLYELPSVRSVGVRKGGLYYPVFPFAEVTP